MSRPHAPEKNETNLLSTPVARAASARLLLRFAIEGLLKSKVPTGCFRVALGRFQIMAEIVDRGNMSPWQRRADAYKFLDGKYDYFDSLRQVWQLNSSPSESEF